MPTEREGGYRLSVQLILDGNFFLLDVCHVIVRCVHNHRHPAQISPTSLLDVRIHRQTNE